MLVDSCHIISTDTYLHLHYYVNHIESIAAMLVQLSLFCNHDVNLHLHLFTRNAEMVLFSRENNSVQSHYPHFASYNVDGE